MERKEKLNEEDIMNVIGAEIIEKDGYWEVYDDVTRNVIGEYISQDYAEWADEKYKLDGTVSFFGYINSNF